MYKVNTDVERCYNVLSQSLEIRNAEESSAVVPRSVTPGYRQFPTS